jgi:hypothetical protein
LILNFFDCTKLSLDIFWAQRRKPRKTDNLQLSGSMFNVQSSILRGEEIFEDLEATLELFREIAANVAPNENELITSD